MGKRAEREASEASDDSLPPVLHQNESDTDTSVGSNDGPDSSDQEDAPVFPLVPPEAVAKTPKVRKEVSFEQSPPTATVSPIGRIAEPIVESDNDDEEYEMVLIKKPIELSIEDLQNVNIFKLAKKGKKFSTDIGKFQTKLTEGRKMYRIPRTTFVNEDDKKKISSNGTMQKSITITRAEENDYDFSNIKVKSIRKKPSLKLDHLKQRLKPFGVIPKKRRRVVDCY